MSVPTEVAPESPLRRNRNPRFDAVDCTSDGGKPGSVVPKFAGYPRSCSLSYSLLQ